MGPIWSFACHACNKTRLNACNISRQHIRKFLRRKCCARFATLLPPSSNLQEGCQKFVRRCTQQRYTLTWNVVCFWACVIGQNVSLTPGVWPVHDQLHLNEFLLPGSRKQKSTFTQLLFTKKLSHLDAGVVNVFPLDFCYCYYKLVTGASHASLWGKINIYISFVKNLSVSKLCKDIPYSCIPPATKSTDHL